MLLEIKKLDEQLNITIDMTAEELCMVMAVNEQLKVLIARAYMMSITLPVKVTKA